MTFLSMFLASTLRRNNAAKRRANVHRVRRSRAAGSVLIHSGQHDSCWLVRVYSNACLTAAGYTARLWLNMCYAGWKWKYTWVYMACAASTFTNKYSRCCSKLYQSSEHSQAFNYGHERPNNRWQNTRRPTDVCILHVRFASSSARTISPICLAFSSQFRLLLLFGV